MSSVVGVWIDPETPSYARTTQSHTMDNNKQDNIYRLVFSDEFAQDGRTFRDGDDPRWTALDKNDVTNNPLHYYSHNNARTRNGKLDITLDLMPQVFPLDNNVTKEARSAMVQSWNKFCFTGGIVEFSAQLPGNPYTGGLWPALWMMGNLGRATFVNSTERMWPFSAGHLCDDRNRVSQEINACHPYTDTDADTDTVAVLGRGAPEVDLLEVMYISQINASMLSASLQVAPGLDQDRPKLGVEPNVSPRVVLDWSSSAYFSVVQ